MKFRFLSFLILFGFLSVSLIGCAEVSVPDARNVNIPNPVAAEKRKEAVNERPDSVMYLPLGEDVLMPARMVGQDLPSDIVGPFELRSETLGGALQLILADYDISIAFESEQGLTRKVTAANLKGPLNKVVKRVCSLADLYCSYEDEALVVKDSQIFTVSLPPLGDAEGGQDFINDVISGLSAIIGSSGSAPVSDPTTRTLIYSATQRTSKLAENYFQRLRANTAMIVFETYIWEVSLTAGNSTGIDWSRIESFGKFNASMGLNGSIGADFTNPVSIGLPTTHAIGASPTQLIEFLAQFGAVKTISQPQITVLSGSSAELRVADTENYVSEVTSTISGDNTTTSVSTDSVDSGFTLTIGSSWDKSTVYANININLTNVDQIEDFTFSDSGAGGTDTIIQLPQTTERELKTQIRVRPGDSVLIAGLVRERDNFDSRGPGFMEPVIPDSRTAQTSNLELVILLRPRVIVYTGADDVRNRGNRASQMLKSSVRRKAADAYTPPVAPIIREPIRLQAPEPVVEDYQPILSAPVIPIEPEPLPEIVEIAPVSPVYKKAVEVAPRVIAPPQVAQPQAIEPDISYQDVVAYPTVNKSYADSYSSYPQEYTPSQASGYVPGYVSGREQVYSSGYQPAPIAPPAGVDSVYNDSNVSDSVTIYEDVIPESYVPTKSPMSADVYNNAQSLNVYDVYERSKGSQ